MMYIRDYKILYSTKDCGDHLEIPGITREDYITPQYMNLINAPVLDRPTAVLFVGGFSVHQGEGRDGTTTPAFAVGSIPLQKSTFISREGTSYSIFKWIGAMENNHHVVYANINSNACASSMHSIYEAEQLLKQGVCEEVIIIAEERTNFNTIRIFKEHRIPITCSDGFAMIRLTSENVNSIGEITDTKWMYKQGRNPFDTSQEGYALVDTDKAIDYIKPHGTNTITNNKAEELITLNRTALYYKKDIGHTQGVSALLELCLVLEDTPIQGNILCVASGFGGFYGSCILHKY